MNCAVVGDEPMARYGRILGFVLREMRILVYQAPTIKTGNNGFSAVLYALRVLVEADGMSTSLAVGEIDEWEAIFLDLFERTKRTLPSKVNPNEYKEQVLSHIGCLREHAYKTPTSRWQRARDEHIKSYLDAQPQAKA